MQTVTTKILCDRAAALLADGTVAAVLGWKRGEFDYDLTPAVFTSVEELCDGFVYNDFSGANLSKYLLNIVFKDVQFLIEQLPIVDTDDGIINSFNDIQSVNTSYSIVLTL